LALIAAVLTYGEIKFLTLYQHAASSAVSLTAKRSAVRKLSGALIAASLFFCGWLFTLRNCWKTRRTATATLSIAAAANCLLYAVFHIPFYDNEYKFIFAVAMCLTVFPGIAVERMWTEWPRKRSVPALIALGAFVLGTYGYYTWRHWPAPWTGPRPAGAHAFERTPLLDATGFNLRLDRREPWSGICEAVTRMTKVDAILVVDNGTFYYPELTARSLYVSAPDRLYAGITLTPEELDGDVRGYGRGILAERRATQAELFGTDDCCREEALNRILALRRPLGIITEPRHTRLAEWLQHSKSARQLYAKDGLTLWGVDGTNVRAK